MPLLLEDNTALVLRIVPFKVLLPLALQPRIEEVLNVLRNNTNGSQHLKLILVTEA